MNRPLPIQPDDELVFVGEFEGLKLYIVNPQRVQQALIEAAQRKVWAQLKSNEMQEVKE